jgi:O-antigen/teichoic acid export membrane protein
VSEAAGRSGSELSGTAAVVVRGSVINVVAMVAGAVMSFGLVVLVSRWLQPRGAGAFFELIALFTILSNTFELGADTGLTRWISRARVIGALGDVRRVVVAALVPVAVVGLAGAAAVWTTAPQIAHFFLRGLPVSQGVTDVRIVAPLIPLGALSACLVDGARGFGRMWPYLLIEGVGKPTLRIALVVTVLAAGLGLGVAVFVWGLPVVAGLAAASIIFVRVLRKEAPANSAPSRRRHAEGAPEAAAEAPGNGVIPSQNPGPAAPVRPVPDGFLSERHRISPESLAGPELEARADLAATFDPVPSVRANGDAAASREGGRHRGPWQPISRRSRQLAAEFWVFTGPRALQASFQVIILWLDILIVGALASSYAAGVYSAVSKLAIIGTFALEGNRLAIGPQLSAQLARHQYDRAAELYQSSTRWLMLASWPLYLTFMVFPATVLGIFGPRYTAGASALVVLSLAMLVNLGTGNVTVVLLMGGRSTWSAVNAGAALAINIGLNLVLVPRIGILGAAIAWAASIVVDNVTAMVEIRWIMGLDPFGPGYWLAAGATVACFGGTGLAARVLLGPSFLTLCVAVAVGLAAFGTLLYFARVPFQLAGVFAALRPPVPRLRPVLPAGGASEPAGSEFAAPKKRKLTNRRQL